MGTSILLNWATGTHDKQRTVYKGKKNLGWRRKESDPEVGIDTDKSVDCMTSIQYPTFDRKEFSKNWRQRSRPHRDLCWWLWIPISRDQIFHFQWKKTSRPIPRFFQRSKWSELYWGWGGSPIRGTRLEFKEGVGGEGGVGGGEEWGLPLLIEN